MEVKLVTKLTITELREFALDFSLLPFSKKLEIAKRLGLLEKHDKYVSIYERFKNIFYQADEQGKLNKLIKAINKARNESAEDASNV